MLLLACREDPSHPADQDQDQGPVGTTGDTGSPATTPPPDLRCDGQGQGEDRCALALADADHVLDEIPVSALSDLGGDGHDDPYVNERESGGSYHSTWRDYQVRFWPDVLALPGASFVVTSRASHSEPYNGTDTGVKRVVHTADVTGDGTADAWFQLPDEWVLVPGPIDRFTGDPQTAAVASTEDLWTTSDADHDGVGEIVRSDPSIRCEGPFSGPVGPECTASGEGDGDRAYYRDLRQADVDFDGDGIDDLLLLELRGDSFTTGGLFSPVLVVRDGDRRRPWTALTRLPLGTPYEPVLYPQSRAADFDGDGFGDLAWVDPISGPGEVKVHHGPVTAALSPQSASLTVVSEPMVLRGAADVEGDGGDELLFTVGDAGGERVLYVMHVGQRGTLFPEQTSYVIGRGEAFDSCGFADLDGDGLADVLVANEGLTYVFLGASLSSAR